MVATNFTNARRFVIAEPLKAALEHGNQALVTSAAAFMSAMFSQQHGVLPWFIAWPLAVGFEWTYLRGLSDSDKTARTGWASALNYAAMVTSVIYGILYILGVYHVIPEQPEGWAAVLLAFAHVIPMAVLSLCSANLRRAHKLRLVARNQKAEDEEVARRLRLQEEEDKLRIEMQRKEAELEMWQKAQLVKAQLRSQVTATTERNQNATATATKQPKKIIYNDVEYDSITAAAEAHGISRQAMKKRLSKVDNDIQ